MCEKILTKRGVSRTEMSINISAKDRSEYPYRYRGRRNQGAGRGLVTKVGN